MKKDRILAKEKFYADDPSAEANYLENIIMKIESEKAGFTFRLYETEDDFEIINCNKKIKALNGVLKEFNADLQKVKDEFPEYFI